MRQTQTVQLDTQSVVVRELTVEETRALMQRTADSSPETFDVVGALLLPLPLGEFSSFCDLTTEQMQYLFPRELRLVYEAARTLNPDFFGMLDRLLNP